MKKLSSYVQLRKEYSVGGQAWAAYWRGTVNRVLTITGDAVPRRYKQRDLKFDLLNNPMEQGVLAV